MWKKLSDSRKRVVGMQEKLEEERSRVVSGGSASESEEEMEDSLSSGRE